jgi:hypothetical protein
MKAYVITEIDGEETTPEKLANGEFAMFNRTAMAVADSGLAILSVASPDKGWKYRQIILSQEEADKFAPQFESAWSENEDSSSNPV